MRCPLGFVLEQTHRRYRISSIDGESMIDPALVSFSRGASQSGKHTLVVGRSNRLFRVLSGPTDHRIDRRLGH
jgi:hypothetical protein